MDIPTLRTFLMWCTIINGGMLMYTFLCYAFAGDWIYRMHSKWFSISRPAFDIAMYCAIGLYKVFVIMFNLVPYLALLLCGQS